MSAKCPAQTFKVQRFGVGDDTVEVEDYGVHEFLRLVMSHLLLWRRERAAL